MVASQHVRYRGEASPWMRIQADLDQIKREMVTKTELAAMMATKADAAVSEERWKGIWQDVAEIRTEMKQRPQMQATNFFQAMGCSINALYVLVACGSLLGTIAAVIVSIIALVR